MATIKAWNATNTTAVGLQVTLDRPATLTQGKRLVAVLPAGSHYLLDALAPFDTPLRYRVDEATIMTRRQPPWGKTQGDILISDIDGRGVWARHRDKGDPVKVETGVKRYTPISGDLNILRYPNMVPPREGTVELYAPTSETADQLLEVLTTQGRVVMATAKTVPGVPSVRVVAVESAETTRITPWGGRYVTVRYETAEGALAPGETAGAPRSAVATYEEARNHSFNYGDGSYIDVLNRVSGARL